MVLSVVSVPASPACGGALLQWPKTAATRAACTASSCRRGASCSFRPRASCSTTTLLRPPSTSCRHTPSSGQYTLLTYSIIGSVHPVDTLHHRVRTPCRHSRHQVSTSFRHTPVLDQYMSPFHVLSTYSIVRSVQPVDTLHRQVSTAC